MSEKFIVGRHPTDEPRNLIRSKYRSSHLHQWGCISQVMASICLSCGRWHKWIECSFRNAECHTCQKKRSHRKFVSQRLIRGNRVQGKDTGLQTDIIRRAALRKKCEHLYSMQHIHAIEGKCPEMIASVDINGQKGEMAIYGARSTIIDSDIFPQQF